MPPDGLARVVIPDDHRDLLERPGQGNARGGLAHLIAPLHQLIDVAAEGGVDVVLFHAVGPRIGDRLAGLGVALQNFAARAAVAGIVMAGIDAEEGIQACDGRLGVLEENIAVTKLDGDSLCAVPLMN